MGPFVVLQESRVEVERCDDGYWITERPLAGLEDRRLAMIVKGLQGILRAERLTMLDMAFLLDESRIEASDRSGHELEPPWFSLFESTPCHAISQVFLSDLR